LPTPDNFDLREIDIVRVRGKEEPIRIYESYDWDQRDRRFRKRELAPLFSRALSHYREGRFDEAVKEFKRYQVELPDDYVVDIYVTRSSTMLRVPPGPDWKGISSI
jgi:adenylate cyclase